MLRRKQSNTDGLREALEALGLAIEPLSAEQAEGAAALWDKGRAYGLSMGDLAFVFFLA